MSVSLPFFTPSLQVGTEQTLETQLSPLAQSGLLLQTRSAAQGVQVLPPQLTSDSSMSLTPS
jgi:hypothetical protein